MATVKLSNYIQLSKSEFDVRKLEKFFTYDNPEYIRNERLGFSNFATPRKISLIRDDGDQKLILPRGLISELSLLEPEIHIIDRTTTNPFNFSPSSINLRNYQQDALKKLLRRNQGILESPPGSGKSVIGIELILKRAQQALVLVHTRDLLQQWKNIITKFTRIKPGVIVADRFDLRPISIGMIQSLTRPLDSVFIKKFGLIMLDEAHHVAADTFNKLINQFTAKYRYGLTATPERGDGLTFLLKATIGPIQHNVEKDQLFETGRILKPKIKVIHTNFYLADCRDYGHLLKKIMGNLERNDLILKYLQKEAKFSHYILVLSERISHASNLYRMFSERYPEFKTVCITSRNNKEQRRAAIDAINNGIINVLFATKLADEGLDIPRLDRLFLTCPVRSKNKISQQVGRIQRTFPGKTDAVVFDFRDSLCSLAESQFNTRLKQVYEAQGFEVEEVPYVVG